MKLNLSAIRNQIFAALVANIGMCGYGIFVGWFSPFMMILKDEKETMMLSGPLSAGDESWIGSCVTLGTAAGTLLFGYIGERIGSRSSLISCSIPFVIGWLIIPFAKYPWHLVCSRFIVGTGGGCLFLNIPLFIAEVSDESCRGALGSTVLIFCEIGILFGYILGTYVPHTSFPYIALIFPIAFFVGFLFFPSTPKYLLRKGKVNQALESLKFYRNSKKGVKDDMEIESELEKLKEVVEANKAISLKMADFLTVKVGKALMVGVTLMVVSEWSGSFTMVNYAASMFASSGSTIDPNVSSFSLGATQIVGTLATLCLIEKLGRKLLLLLSTIGVAVGTAIVALYSFMYTQSYSLDNFNFVPVVSLSFAVFAGSIGIIPIPYILAAELFPQKVRQVGAIVCVVAVGLASFGILKAYPLMEQQFNLYGTMILFCTVAILGAIFTHFVVEETKGKNLDLLNSKEQGLDALKKLNKRESDGIEDQGLDALKNFSKPESDGIA